MSEERRWTIRACPKCGTLWDSDYDKCLDDQAPLDRIEVVPAAEADRLRARIRQGKHDFAALRVERDRYREALRNKDDLVRQALQELELADDEQSLNRLSRQDRAIIFGSLRAALEGSEDE